MSTPINLLLKLITKVIISTKLLNLITKVLLLSNHAQRAFHFPIVIDRKGYSVENPIVID